MSMIDLIIEDIATFVLENRSVLVKALHQIKEDKISDQLEELLDKWRKTSEEFMQELDEYLKRKREDKNENLLD
jgi:flagellar biogenesis protein FliO